MKKTIKNTLSLLCLFFYSSPGFTLVQDDLDVGEILVTEEDNVQTLINNADAVENPTLVFDVGTYTLNLTVNKSMTLKGISTGNVLLKSNGINPIINISDGATVTIQNFTFSDTAAIAAINAEFSTAATIQNNIFTVSVNGTAIALDSTSTVTVQNNTFHNINTGINVLDGEQSITVKNNIFSNFANVNELFLNVINTGVTYNCFDQLVPVYSVAGSNKVASDLGLVDKAENDFHLLDDSICKDTGEGFTDKDVTQTDMGAYGGAEADQYASPVSDITVTDIADGSVSVSWDKNLDYRIDGYRVYFQKDSLKNLTKNERALLIPKELDATTTTVQIDGLDSTIDSPSIPLLNSVQPVSSGKLSIKWTKVSGASDYTLYYRATDAADFLSIKNLGDTDKYVLTGLVNGTSYTVGVAAVNQLQYSFQVVGFIDADGVLTEGLFLNSDTVHTLDSKEGGMSNILAAIPEAIVPYPALPNEGCFIATAAFGYYSHSQVQVLRDFRDNYLLTNSFGAEFVNWYYHYGPYAAKYINEYEILKPVVRITLYPLILLAQASAYNNALFWGVLILYLFVLIVTLKIIRQWFFRRLNVC